MTRERTNIESPTRSVGLEKGAESSLQNGVREVEDGTESIPASAVKWLEYLVGWSQDNAGEEAIFPRSGTRLLKGARVTAQ